MATQVAAEQRSTGVAGRHSLLIMGENVNVRRICKFVAFLTFSSIYLVTWRVTEDWAVSGSFDRPGRYEEYFMPHAVGPFVVVTKDWRPSFWWEGVATHYYLCFGDNFVLIYSGSPVPIESLSRDMRHPSDGDFRPDEGAVAPPRSVEEPFNEQPWPRYDYKILLPNK